MSDESTKSSPAVAPKLVIEVDSGRVELDGFGIWEVAKKSLTLRLKERSLAEFWRENIASDKLNGSFVRFAFAVTGESELPDKYISLIRARSVSSSPLAGLELDSPAYNEPGPEVSRRSRVGLMPPVRTPGTVFGKLVPNCSDALFRRNNCVNCSDSGNWKGVCELWCGNFSLNFMIGVFGLNAVYWRCCCCCCACRRSFTLLCVPFKCDPTGCVFRTTPCDTEPRLICWTDDAELDFEPEVGNCLLLCMALPFMKWSSGDLMRPSDNDRRVNDCGGSLLNDLRKSPIDLTLFQKIAKLKRKQEKLVTFS